MTRFRFARIHRPYTLVFALVMPICGALALVFGDAVSAALSSISTGVLSRVMGAALFGGSVLTLVGIGRGKSLWEAYGLTVMAAGCIIYGIGVILGLGLAGAVAGPGFLGIAAGTILRVVSLAAAAREVAAGDERGVDGKDVRT